MHSSYIGQKYDYHRYHHHHHDHITSIIKVDSFHYLKNDDLYVY
jgi:hypothetical protein